MVEALGDPLFHMIRNALDHGIESADARRVMGKPPIGTLRLRAYHSAGNVVLELQVPEEELFERLAGRGRADDTPEVIRQRLVAYREQTEPLLQYYGQRGLLQGIGGVGTVDEIFERAKVVLDETVG